MLNRAVQLVVLAGVTAICSCDSGNMTSRTFDGNGIPADAATGVVTDAGTADDETNGDGSATDGGNNSDGDCPAEGESVSQFRGYNCVADAVYSCGPPEGHECTCAETTCLFKLDMCGKVETRSCRCRPETESGSPDAGGQSKFWWKCGSSGVIEEWCLTVCPFRLMEQAPLYGCTGFPLYERFAFANQSGEFFEYETRTGTRSWSIGLSGTVRATPAFQQTGGKTGYLGTSNGSLYAFTRNASELGYGTWIDATGSIAWTFQTQGTIESSAAIGLDGAIYFGSSDGNLYALNPEGNLRWAFAAAGPIKSSPAIGANGTVFVGSDDGRLYAVAPDGSLAWSVETDGEVFSSPALDLSGAVVFGSTDGTVRSVSADGTVKWTYQTAGEVRSSPAIDTYGVVYIGSNDGTFHAIEKNGSLKWSYRTVPGAHSSPDFYTAAALSEGGHVFVGRRDGYLLRFNRDGSVAGEERICSEISGHPSISSWRASDDGDGSFTIGCTDGIYGYGRDGNYEWGRYGVLSKTAPWPKFRRDDWNSGNIGTR